MATEARQALLHFLKGVGATDQFNHFFLVVILAIAILMAAITAFGRGLLRWCNVMAANGIEFLRRLLRLGGVFIRRAFGEFVRVFFFGGLVRLFFRCKFGRRSLRLR